MDFFKRLFSPAKPQKEFYSFYVKCTRCKETLEGRVDIHNDLSLSEDESFYFTRKTLMGDKLCFQRIEVELNFDLSRRVTDRTIIGGEFVDNNS
jgi:hypothetical protein